MGTLACNLLTWILFRPLPEYTGKGLAAPYDLLCGIVVKVPLDKDHRGALIAGAGGQIAQGTDQIGQASGGVEWGERGGNAPQT